jgi:hypothetical protein
MSKIYRAGVGILPTPTPVTHYSVRLDPDGTATISWLTPKGEPDSARFTLANRSLIRALLTHIEETA